MRRDLPKFKPPPKPPSVTSFVRASQGDERDERDERDGDRRSDILSEDMRREQARLEWERNAKEVSSTSASLS